MTMIIGGTSGVTFPDSTVQTTATLGQSGSTASGNTVLTASSGGAQSIATTTWGQTVTLPSATTMSKGACVFNINNTGGYPLKIVDNAGNTLGFIYQASSVTIGLADNSTAAGVWNISGADFIAVTGLTLTNVQASSLIGRVAVDSSRILLCFYSNTSGIYYGIIFNSSTQTWGTVVNLGTQTNPNNSLACLILSGTNQVLFIRNDNTSNQLFAETLTISGTSITVNTATIAASNSYTMVSSFVNLVQIGSSFVMQYYSPTTSSVAIRALTISGTTVTIGAETSLNGTDNSSTYLLQVVNSSVVLAISTQANVQIYATPYTISGTTITAGTGITISSSITGFRFLPISNGTRWVIVNSDGTNYNGTIISVSGTTASSSSAVLVTSANSATLVSQADMIVSGSTLIFATTAYLFANTLTDTSGTATAGTQISFGILGSVPIFAVSAINNIATFVYSNGTSAAVKLNINFSTPLTPTLSSQDYITGTATTGTFGFAVSSTFYGYRPSNALVSSQTFCIAGASTGRKVGVVSQTGFYAYSSKFNTASPLLIGVKNNDGFYLLNASTPSGNTLLYYIESIT